MENATCKYCGTDLDQHLTCSYCSITFSPEEVCYNKERPHQMVDSIPIIDDFETMIFELMSRPTETLLKEKTITLYYLLRAARKAKDKYFRAKDQERLTFFQKKVYTIENILLEREGTFPLSISDNLLKKKSLQVNKFEQSLSDNNRNKMTRLLIRM
ncbi:hypothetical protein [Enterococcus plantarum]|uniref:hypothetical protein n=1 Tax=Enterococcus plantarum TaxID=1077675 RepID=UPI001A8D861D|nr:hypothetical protein [Enterococcus plantarum]MBO0423403.1 hypothetical protein [Enterococcus plantarum]